MNLLWALLILTCAVAVAVGAMLFVRRTAPEGSYFEDGDRASGVFGVLATGFAIFAGFVIFLAFTSYDQSRSGAEAEALVVVQQFETAQFLPANVRPRLTGELVCYGRSVVSQEWPRMQDGTAGDAINPWSVALFTSLKLAKPTTSDGGGRLREVARSDLGSRGGAPRPCARCRRHHSELDLARPLLHGGHRVRVHAVFRRQRRACSSRRRC